MELLNKKAREDINNLITKLPVIEEIISARYRKNAVSISNEALKTNEAHNKPSPTNQPILIDTNDVKRKPSGNLIKKIIISISVLLLMLFFYLTFSFYKIFDFTSPFQFNTYKVLSSSVPSTVPVNFP